MAILLKSVGNSMGILMILGSQEIRNLSNLLLVCKWRTLHILYPLFLLLSDLLIAHPRIQSYTISTPYGLVLVLANFSKFFLASIPLVIIVVFLILLGLILQVYIVALFLILMVVKPKPWILDSGVANHMTPYKHLLHNIEPLPFSFLVTLPNGYKVKVIFTGSLQLT